MPGRGGRDWAVRTPPAARKLSMQRFHRHELTEHELIRVEVRIAHNNSVARRQGCHETVSRAGHAIASHDLTVIVDLARRRKCGTGHVQ